MNFGGAPLADARIAVQVMPPNIQNAPLYPRLARLTYAIALAWNHKTIASTAMEACARQPLLEQDPIGLGIFKQLGPRLNRVQRIRDRTDPRMQDADDSNLLFSVKHPQA